MPRIVVLAESIVSRIAAGEVVERPASAVKELVENAIDARARTIEVALEAGGRDGITVTDDGEGMGPDDLLLALERHATSKIHSHEDIEQVRTLGFRGEAIPSIASVCRFRMTSRDGQSDTATLVEVNGGRLVGVKQQPGLRGTRVEALGLFYNAPARRKFLRSAETERQRVVEIVTRFALGYPEIRFRMISDGRLVCEHPPVGDPLERCARVLGRQLSGALLRAEAATGDLSLLGLCSGLSDTRSHPRDQHLFVNRRPVRDRLLAHAISAAYGDVLPRGRHPVLVLLIVMPPALVDVNVHPSKAEVRFKQAGEVHDFVVEALRSVLRQAGAVPPLGLSRLTEDLSRGPAGPPPVDRPLLAAGAGSIRAFAQPEAGVWARHREHAVLEPRLPGTGGFTYSPASFPVSAGEEDLLVAPLGQFLDSYILARDADGLLIVDQHVAHERVLYERILDEVGPGTGQTQRLLSPVPVDFPAAERELAWQSMELLGLAGFDLEEFGEGAVLVRGIPAGLDGVDPERLLREIISDLREGDQGGPTEASRLKIAASAACHAAIKVHFPLTVDKMAWLLVALFRCKTPTTCPHGRPIILRIGREEIERGFHRL